MLLSFSDEVIILSQFYSTSSQQPLFMVGEAECMVLTCWQVVWHFTGAQWMRLVRVITSCSSVHTQSSQELLGTIAPGWKYRGERRQAMARIQWVLE